MKKRVLAAMMACAMAAGLLSGCSSEPKNPGDSNEPVTTAAAGQTEAGDATAAAQEESGPKIFHDYMTTDVDTINPHIYTMSVFRRRDRQDFPPALPPVPQRGGDQL